MVTNGSAIERPIPKRWFWQIRDLVDHRKMLAAGAQGGTDLSSGNVRIWALNETAEKWNPISQELQGDNPEDSFGVSVTLAQSEEGGLRMAAGANGYDENGADVGVVEVFECFE